MKLAGVTVPAEERLRVRQNVEVAKRRLSNHDVARVGIAGVELDLTRDQFESATAGITARIRPVVSRCLRDGGIAAAQLDDILLVGGASRMQPVISFVQETFKRIPNRRLDPDRVIALGAAVQGALCADDEAVSDLVLTDVCPHTLGVEVSKELSPGKIDEGNNLEIVGIFVNTLRLWQN